MGRTAWLRQKQGDKSGKLSFIFDFCRSTDVKAESISENNPNEVHDMRRNFKE